MPRTTHGMSRTPTYKVWKAMKERCLNPDADNFEYYGGRGIKVCDRWLNSFEAFLEDMGLRPLGMQIDRENGDGDYEPANCRWVTRRRNINNRADLTRLDHDGLSLTASEWSDRTGISRKTIVSRLNLGWSIEDALTKPVANVGKRASQSQLGVHVDD